MRLCLFLAIESCRLALAVGAWIALVALASLLVPEAPAAHIALMSRDCGPLYKRASSPPAAARRVSVSSAPSVPSRAHKTSGRLARITVYAPDEPRSDYWTRRRKSATGVRLAWGHCAVDPRRIPYGSTVIVGNKKFLAVDCGGFRGWWVDIYFDRWRDAVRFDRSTPDHMPITVIRPRS